MVAAGLDPVRIENMTGPGIPDVNFKHGWVELKNADKWPVRGGPLRLNHPPSPAQRAWLYRRWRAGGLAVLLVRVGKEWFLFRGLDVPALWATDPNEQQIRCGAFATLASPRAVAEFLKEMTI